METHRIAIVDDDIEFLGEMEDLLRAHGFETETYSEPATLLAAAADSPADAFVVDLRMCGQGGLRLVRELRRLPRTVQTPIVALSAFHRAEELSALAESIGIDRWIMKPFDPYDLLDQLRSLWSEDQ
ncbi:MAG TPA: hypothetical protein DCM87_10845 [Planctomycetes bacterium]|nr:hypothetical protein [Planctomycetota bacterium]